MTKAEKRRGEREKERVCVEFRPLSLGPEAPRFILPSQSLDFSSSFDSESNLSILIWFQWVHIPCNQRLLIQEGH